MPLQKTLLDLGIKKTGSRTISDAVYRYHEKRWLNSVSLNEDWTHCQNCSMIHLYFQKCYPQDIPQIAHGFVEWSGVYYVAPNFSDTNIMRDWIREAELCASRS